jgi:hypothetical protein
VNRIRAKQPHLRQVHHKQLRSQQGSDDELSLVAPFDLNGPLRIRQSDGTVVRPTTKARRRLAPLSKRFPAPGHW